MTNDHAAALNRLIRRQRIRKEWAAVLATPANDGQLAYLTKDVDFLLTLVGVEPPELHAPLPGDDGEMVGAEEAALLIGMSMQGLYLSRRLRAIAFADDAGTLYWRKADCEAIGADKPTDPLYGLTLVAMADELGVRQHWLKRQHDCPVLIYERFNKSGEKLRLPFVRYDPLKTAAWFASLDEARSARALNPKLPRNLARKPL